MSEVIEAKPKEEQLTGYCILVDSLNYEEDEFGDPDPNTGYIEATSFHEHCDTGPEAVSQAVGYLNDVIAHDHGYDEDQDDHDLFGLVWEEYYSRKCGKCEADCPGRKYLQEVRSNA